MTRQKRNHYFSVLVSFISSSPRRRVDRITNVGVTEGKALCLHGLIPRQEAWTQTPLTIFFFFFFEARALRILWLKMHVVKQCVFCLVSIYICEDAGPGRLSPKAPSPNWDRELFWQRPVCRLQISRILVEYIYTTHCIQSRHPVSKKETGRLLLAKSTIVSCMVLGCEDKEAV